MYHVGGSRRGSGRLQEGKGGSRRRQEELWEAPGEAQGDQEGSEAEKFAYVPSKITLDGRKYQVYVAFLRMIIKK